MPLESGRWRVAVRVVLVAAVVAGAIQLSRTDFRAAISTNVIDLLPAAERDPELQALRGFVDDAQARVVRGVLATPAGAPSPAATQAFVRVLRDSGSFTEVALLDDPAGRERLGAFLFERRLDYLLPDWLEERRREYDAAQTTTTWSEWLAGRVAERLEAFLARPESAAFEPLLTRDPLLLVPDLAARSEWFAGGAEADPAVRLWARTRESPLAEAGQDPVFAALAEALEAARAVQPDVSWQWTGVHRFAAASKARIRQELTWLNTAALAGVIVSVCLLVRRPWQALHLLPIVGLSLLAAWVGVLGAFERVHILVFVLGALLSGAAVDYGFHLGVFAAAGRPWRAVLPPLLASCLTTVLGFALLGFSDLPLLRQLSVFVCAGLLGALAAALLYTVQRRQPALEARPWSLRLPAALRRLLPVAAVLAAAGLVRVQWRDDVRDLQVDDPALRAIDRAVRAQFGETGARTLYLVHGDDPRAARERLARFTDWHRRRFPDTGLAGVGLLWPAPDAAAEARAGVAGFPAALERALRARDFTPEAFAPFFAEWEAWRAAPPPAPLDLWRDLAAHLPPPLADSAHVVEGPSWFIVAADGAEAIAPPPELGATNLNRLESLNHLFRRYRHQALQLSLAGLGLLAASVVALYGPRRGARVFLIPATATAVAFGLVGWTGDPLNLFHLLGAFLGVCLSHDYAIFGEAHRGPGEPAPASVRLSALTTAASFGVLAFSRIPAVASLGLTVTLIVLVALLTVEARSFRPA